MGLTSPPEEVRKYKGVRGRHPDAPPQNGSPCPGCAKHRARTHFEHNRVLGECGYPYDDPEIWECDACMEGKGRNQAGHTGVVGKCKWASTPERQSHTRSGRHPCDPASSASGDPTAHLPGTDRTGELGADAEERHASADSSRLVA